MTEEVKREIASPRDTSEITNWTLSLSEPWFSFVKAGKKLYEGRLCRGLVKYFNVDDTITFYCDDKILDPVVVRIVNVTMYDSFRDALAALGLSHTLPGVGSLDVGEKIYYQFASAESQRKYGVVMVSIALKK